MRLTLADHHRDLLRAMICLLVAVVGLAYATSVPTQAQSCELVDIGCQGFCDGLGYEGYTVWNCGGRIRYTPNQGCCYNA